MDDVTAVAGVTVDYDPAVWLPGPTGPDTERWVDGAFAACISDFAIEADAPQAAYLRELLTLFATRDLQCDFRFLRLRTPTASPLIARLSLFAGTHTTEPGHLLDTFDADAASYDRSPRITTVDPERRLRRSVVYSLEDGVVRPVVRYHRRVDALATDLVLASSGATLRTTAEGLADLDALAAAVWLVDEEGTRR